MKLKPNKKFKGLNKGIGVFTIIYGILFIIVDVIHYFHKLDVEKRLFESDLTICFYIPFEPIEIKIYNIVVHLLFIIAGISFLRKKAISWNIYIFSLLCVILKFPSLVFWDSFYRTNWIESTFLPYLLTIAGLVYFSKPKVKRLVKHSPKKNTVRYFFYSLIILLTLSIISINLIWTPRKQLTDTLNEVYDKNEISKYKHHFINILDTTYINWNNIHGIGISILNDSNQPIYIEKLQIGDFDILCYHFKYDGNDNLIQEFDPMPFYNSIIYEYDTLNRVTTKKLCASKEYIPFSSNYDTITNEENCMIFYKYEYFDNKIVETGYRSEKDPFLKYELIKNSKGNIIKRRVINGYPNEGTTYYYYDSKSRKVRIEEYKSRDKLWRKVLHHYKNDRLIKSEELIYGETSLHEKFINLIKFKSYSAKDVIYYFKDSEI